MTHLYIEQATDRTEEVNSSIISKLYELAISGDLDETSDLKGRLHSITGYKFQIDYLNNNFQDLIVSADNKYQFFEDKAVENILATNWGDGTGITASQIASVQNFNLKFSNKQNIQTFNELSKFTNITEINNSNRFNGCTNLRSIDLKNITKISGVIGNQRWNFEDCSNLENVGDISNCLFFGYYAFRNCSKLTTVDAPNATEFYTGAFDGCTNLNLLIDQSKITKIDGPSVFKKCAKIQGFSTINMPNLTGEILGGVFTDCTQIENVVNLGKITAIGQPYYNDGVFKGCTNLKTVVLPETVTKIYNSLISRSVRWVKLLSTIVPEYDTSDTKGNIRTWGHSFGESYRNDDVTNTYLGHTYPIYVKDELLSQYQAADVWKYVGPGRLRPLSQFVTDFPDE